MPDLPPYHLEVSPLFRRTLGALPRDTQVQVFDALADLAASGDPMPGLAEHPAYPGHAHIRRLHAAGCNVMVTVWDALLVLEAVSVRAD